MLKEFKEFAIKGNMVDMAVGIIIGGAFGTVVTSLVADILTPIVAAAAGGPDFSNMFLVLSNPNNVNAVSVTAAREGGASVLAIGLFVNALTAFLMMALALFFVVKAINALRREHAVAPAPPLEPPAQERLLAEIRDLLQRQPGR
ncbi:MAG: large conductance mechanosensitive channel protein MscL [Acidobacteriota bacterium]